MNVRFETIENASNYNNIIVDLFTNNLLNDDPNSIEESSFMNLVNYVDYPECIELENAFNQVDEKLILDSVNDVIMPSLADKIDPSLIESSDWVVVNMTPEHIQSIYDFDLEILGEADNNKNHYSSGFELNCGGAITDKKYDYNNSYEFTCNLPVNIPPTSPTNSIASTSSSSSLRSQKGHAKRGRKPINWNDAAMVSNLLAFKSGSDLYKTKNNISSGKYRKRKADEKEKLLERIKMLEAKNEYLTRQVKKNSEWLHRAQVLFPDISIPW